MVVATINRVKHSLGFMAPPDRAKSILLTNPTAFQNYLDGLMLIHDFLCGFSKTQDGPRYSVSEAENRFFEVYQELAPDRTNDRDELIRHNLRHNASVAEDIRRLAEEGFTPSDTDDTVEDFIEGLLQTYAGLTRLQRDTMA